MLWALAYSPPRGSGGGILESLRAFLRHSVNHFETDLRAFLFSTDVEIISILIIVWAFGNEVFTRLFSYELQYIHCDICEF